MGSSPLKNISQLGRCFPMYIYIYENDKCSKPPTRDWCIHELPKLNPNMTKLSDVVMCLRSIQNLLSHVFGVSTSLLPIELSCLSVSFPYNQYDVHWFIVHCTVYIQSINITKSAHRVPNATCSPNHTPRCTEYWDAILYDVHSASIHDPQIKCTHMYHISYHW